MSRGLVRRRGMGCWPGWGASILGEEGGNGRQVDAAGLPSRRPGGELGLGLRLCGRCRWWLRWGRRWGVDLSV